MDAPIAPPDREGWLGVMGGNGRTDTMTRLLALAALGSMLAIAGCSSGPATGSAAPAFDGVDQHGNTFSLAAYEGKVVILDFWAVW